MIQLVVVALVGGSPVGAGFEWAVECCPLQLLSLVGAPTEAGPGDPASSLTPGSWGWQG